MVFVASPAPVKRVPHGSRQPAYRELHRIADGGVPRVVWALRVAWGRMGTDASLRALAKAAATGQEQTVFQVLGLHEDVPARQYPELLAELRRLYARAGDVTAARLPARKPVLQAHPAPTPLDKRTVVTGRFDMTSPEAIAFLTGYTLDLITRMNRKQREAIRAILLEGQEVGIPPEAQARKIREYIGLLPRQQQQLDRYVEMLVSEGYRGAQLKSRRDRMRKRLLTQRTKVIAQTETIRAANMGQQAMWRQAMQEQLIDRTTVKRVWIVTPDDRLCPWCRKLKGKVVGMEEQFVSAVRNERTGRTTTFTSLTPPIHPQCRCAIALDFSEE